MSDKTVIYYTHNRELPDFERKIKESIVEEKGDLPLISVSQKPIHFGENICVGEQGANSLNTWRQILIGCKAAKTRFVCLTESDTLHHRSYFTFIPDRDDLFYVFIPFYILFAQRGKGHAYYLKDPNDTNTAVGRLFLIDRIERILDGLPLWQRETDYEVNPFKKMHNASLSEGCVIYRELEVPIVTFKTDQGMHRRSPHHRGGIVNLPYWGESRELCKRYCP